MENFERYTALHEELMKRLENGEITTEQAKILNDKFFDKYVVESAYDFKEGYDENELEVYEESARNKYLDKLEEEGEKIKKEAERVQKLISHATGDKKKSLEKRLGILWDKLNDVERKIKTYGMDRTSRSDGYGPNSIRTAGRDSKYYFDREFGSKDPKNEELHDNINNRK